jgi:3-oxoacyl-[acyl-carrier-protein] synthase-3
LNRPRFGFLGLGSYLPARVLTNQDLERIVDTTNEWILQRTGIQERRILGENETVLDMAVHAARKALADAGLGPADIGDIRVAVNTWMRFPSLATQVQAALGIVDSSASDVAAGCAGFIYAVEDAYNKLSMEQERYGRELRALVIGVDGLSLITDWTDRNTCVLLGDGAGAAVMGPARDNEILAVHTEAQGKYGDLLFSDEILERQAIPGSPIRFKHETCAARPYLHMDGAKVFAAAVRVMTGNVRRVVQKHSAMNPGDAVRLEDIGYVFPHQANHRIIAAVADSLGVPLDRVYTEGIRKYGNTSAASIPIGWDECRDQARGKLIVDVAFGAGFASGAVLRRG